MADQLMHDAHRQLSETIEKLAVDAHPGARTTPLAVRKFLDSPEGRKLANAASTIHRAARR